MVLSAVKKSKAKKGHKASWDGRRRHRDKTGDRGDNES